MPHSPIPPIHDRSSEAHSSGLAIAFGDTEIQALLESQRQNLIEVTNFLEAICAKLNLSAAGTPRLSIVGESLPTNSAQAQ